MKVVENAAERTADAHIFVEGRVKPLEEYGQYVDGHDKALCCYVPVEEGHKIRVDTRFAGTTLALVHDVLIDGVCRKTNTVVGKSVQVQKKRVLFETFLYQMPDAVMDTAMAVATHHGPVNLDKEAREAVGTIELRVYITRQLGVEHEIKDLCTYDKVQEGADSSTRVATYKDVPPQFRMTFEKNCSTLEGPKANRERKKMYAKRPGMEPWAIFRFHYRTKESIVDLNMELTFDPTNKAHAKKEAHALDLEPVPTLSLGSKPAGKNDGENSMRTSSPPLPHTPSTPVKDAKKSQPTQPKVIVKKQLNKDTPVNSKPASDMDPVNQTQIGAVIELSAAATIPISTSSGLQPVFNDDSSTNKTAKEVSHNKTGNIIPAVIKEKCGTAPAEILVMPTKKIAREDLGSTGPEADTKGEVLKKALDELITKPGTGLAVLGSPISPVEVSNVPTVPHPADVPSAFDSTIPVAARLETKDLTKSGSKGFTSPLKKANIKPGPINTNTSTVLQKPALVTAPLTPVKRALEALEGTLTPPPDIKRLKTEIVPPLTPTHVPRNMPGSPSPRTPSVEAQVAEQRLRLQATRKKRAEVAKKKAVLDERMLPYKQRMAEELERLKEQMAAEEAMMAEEEEDFRASEAMLAEFERTGGDV